MRQARFLGDGISYVIGLMDGVVDALENEKGKEFSFTGLEPPRYPKFDPVLNYNGRSTGDIVVRDPGKLMTSRGVFNILESPCLEISGLVLVCSSDAYVRDFIKPLVEGIEHARSENDMRPLAPVAITTEVGPAPHYMLKIWLWQYYYKPIDAKEENEKE